MTDSSLFKILRAVAENTHPASAFKALKEELTDALNADRCLIVVFKEEPGRAETTTIEIRDMSEKMENNQPDQAFSRNVVRQVQSSKKTILIPNAVNDSRYNKYESVISRNFLSLLVAPMIVQEQVYGAFYVDRLDPRKGSFTGKNSKFLNEIAASVAPLFARWEEALLLRETVENLSDYLFAKIGIIGNSTAMKDVYKKVRAMAAFNEPVLLTGETGTGKELIAQAIHMYSKRQQKPFIAINMGAIPPTLIESELFGHEKGAYTDGTYQRLGKFELAHDGTLFLDEIGDASPEVQLKLLRAIDKKQIERVGGQKIIDVNVRLVSATNKNLSQAMNKAMFREDLYYRLHRFMIDIPPLRNRLEDIPDLCLNFLKKFCQDEEIDLPEVILTAGALDKLRAYRWPGNVRELRNIIIRSFALCERRTEPLTADDILFDEYSPPPTQQTLKEIGIKAQCQALRESLAKHNWNKAKVIAELSTNYVTLDRLIAMCGIKPD